MEVDGKTKVCALLGDPVEHTLSPLLHNSFGKSEKVNAVYTAFNVKKEGLEAALKGAFALGIRGFNVTVPHKESVIPFLSGMDPLAERIGAVNTLALTDKGYKGYNTDATGFMRSALGFEDEIRDREVIMIGAGGAANAVLCGLYELGAKRVYILNRSDAKAEAKFGGDKRNVILPLEGFRDIPDNKYFCAQCTSVGLSPNNEAAPIEDEDFYKKIGSAIDIIYKPEETRFMRMVREKGGRAENGLPMLLFQAVESFRIFHGVTVGDEGIKEAKDRLYRKVYGNGKNST